MRHTLAQAPATASTREHRDPASGPKKGVVPPRRLTSSRRFPAQVARWQGCPPHTQCGPPSPLLSSCLRPGHAHLHSPPLVGQTSSGQWTDYRLGEQGAGIKSSRGPRRAKGTHRRELAGLCLSLPGSGWCRGPALAGAELRCGSSPRDGGRGKGQTGAGQAWRA